MIQRLYIASISLILLLSACNQVYHTDVIGEMQAAFSDGDCAKVNQLATENLNTHKDNGVFFYYKGICENRNGNYEASILSLAKAEELNTQPRAGIYLNMAASHASLGNGPESFQYLEKLADTGFKNEQLLQRKDFDSIRESSEFKSAAARIKPSYNLWTSLFLFVSLQALFVGITLFFLKKSQSNANKLLGILMLSFALVIFSFTLYWSGYSYKFPYLNHLYHLLPYAAGPLLYLYARNLVKNRELQIRDSIHFIPLILVAAMLSPYIIANYVNVNTASIPQWMGNVGSNWYSKIGFLVLYTVLTINLISSVDRKDQNVKNWLIYLAFGFSGYVLAMLSYYILIQFSFFSPAWDYGISFALSFFIFMVSFMGYLQPRVFAGESVKEILKPAKYQKTGLTKKAELELRDKLEEAMIMDNLYTNGDLRLDDLAEFVGSNRHNVSLVINKYFDGNYFDFLNRYRIDHVKRLMKNPKNLHYTLIQLAYEAGFNNKVSFNKAFKKFNGMTPTAYKRSAFKDITETD